MIWQRLAYPRRERIELWHALATMVASELPLPEALEAIAAQERTQRGPGGLLRSLALGQAVAVIRAGSPEAAFDAIAPSAERVVISYTGLLPGPEPFEAAARVAETMAGIRAAVLRALLEPLLYLLAVVALLYFAGGWFLPPFAAQAPLETWPALSQNIGRIALGLHARPLLPLLVLGGGILAVAASMPWWTGFGRTTADRFPPWALYRIGQGAAFVLAIRQLLRLGLAPDADAFARLRSAASPWLRNRIGALQRRMEAGAGFGAALAAGEGGFPDPKICALAGALAGARDFETAFGTAADRWLARIAVDVRAAAVLLQFLLLTLVAVLLLALLQTMFTLFSLVA